MVVWFEVERTGTTARVEYQDARTFTYDSGGSWSGGPVPAVIISTTMMCAAHHCTELPHQRAFEWLVLRLWAFTTNAMAR